ncbi:hypothetical protein TL16_g05101 [Triparma laevis f. inornata]|uniref:Glycolipid transfer protein domain-containing protein n=1 Tax=Triparma laevis f. inornata TaxID=1714386 RepID=A0A9W7ABY8_9STRA|nr:hypothetical protein TL16_g05101 [Triparma laevis f. inornata]
MSKPIEPLVTFCGQLFKNSGGVFNTYSSRYVVLTSTGFHWFLKPHNEGDNKDEILFGTHRGSLSLDSITSVTLDTSSTVLTVCSTTKLKSGAEEKREAKFKNGDGNGPKVADWCVAINKAKNLRAAGSGGSSSSRGRNASISGDYFSPVPTILALISSDNSSLLSVEPSFDSTTKIVSNSAVDKGVICYLSDGSKIKFDLDSGKVNDNIKFALSKSREIRTSKFVKQTLIILCVSYAARIEYEIDLKIFTALMCVALTLTTLENRQYVYDFNFTLTENSYDIENDDDLEADAAIAVCGESEHTCLHDISNKFKLAYDPQTKIIHLPKLLIAAESFLEILRAMGPTMTLAVKDFQGNLKKGQMQMNISGGDDMKLVLVAEKATGMHKPGGMNKDPSTAAGLLWMRRSISFQLEIFKALLGKEDSLKAANAVAYEKELEMYHGWLLKKIFSKVISSSPSRENFEEKLAPSVVEGNRRRIVEQDMQVFCDSLGPIVEAWRAVFKELDLEDLRKV